MCACFHEFQLTFQTDVTLKSPSFWTIRFVEFTLRFTVLLMVIRGQLWLTKKTWFCISSLLLNHLNVMVHLLVKSTYFIRPKSLTNLCSNPFFEGPDDILRMKRSQDSIWVRIDRSILTSSEYQNSKWRCTWDSHVYWLKSCLSRKNLNYRWESTQFTS